MKDYENPFDDETVSYNEGLGDLLKEKPKVEFSLGKTILVLTAFVGVIALSVFAISKIAKAIIVPVPDHQATTIDFKDIAEDDDRIANNSSEKTLALNSDLKEIIANRETSSFEPKTKQAPVKDLKPNATLAKTPESNSIERDVKSFNQTRFAALEKLKETSKNKAIERSNDPNSLYRVLIGQFTNRGAADRMIQQLKDRNVSAYVWRHTEDNQAIFRVQVGAFSKRQSAEYFQKSLTKKGLIRTFYIVNADEIFIFSVPIS